jgi:hypothetical protein
MTPMRLFGVEKHNDGSGEFPLWAHSHLGITCHHETMPNRLSYADAAKILGGSRPLAKAVDNLLGGALSVATAGGSDLAIGLFDAKTEVVRLGCLVTAKSTIWYADWGRLPGSRWPANWCRRPCRPNPTAGTVARMVGR